jgi:hypothetical protein
VHHEAVGVELPVLHRLVRDLVGGVRQGDRHARTAHGLEAGRAGVLVDLALQAGERLVVDRRGDPLAVGPQVGDLAPEILVLLGLGLGERGQVGVAPGPQVGALAVVVADREQGSAEEHHDGRADPPQAAPVPGLGCGILRGSHVLSGHDD